MPNLKDILTKKLTSFTERDWPNKLYIAKTPLPPDLKNVYFVPDIFRIYICIYGEERMKIPTPKGYRTVPLFTGDALLVFPGCTVTLQSNGKESFKTLGVFFEKDSVEVVQNDNTSWPYHHTRFIYPCSSKLMKEKKLIDNCFQLLIEDDSDEDIKTKVNSVRLIISLLARMFKQPYFNSFTTSQKKEIALQNMLFYIREHAYKPLKRIELANTFNLPATTITSFFQTKFNTTFKSYLTNLKMQHACRMLLTSNLRIKDISSKVGYAYPESFIQKFGQFFKISPKQLKKLITQLHPEGKTDKFTLPLICKSELEGADTSYLKDDKRPAIKTHVFNLSNQMVQLFRIKKGYKHFNCGKITSRDLLTIDCNIGDIIIVKDLQDNVLGFYKTGDKSSIALFSLESPPDDEEKLAIEK